MQTDHWVSHLQLDRARKFAELVAVDDNQPASVRLKAVALIGILDGDVIEGVDLFDSAAYESESPEEGE